MWRMLYISNQELTYRVSRQVDALGHEATAVMDLLWHYASVHVRAALLGEGLDASTVWVGLLTYHQKLTLLR